MKTLFLALLAFTVALFRAAFGCHYLPRARAFGWVTMLDLKKMSDGAGYNLIEENVKIHPELRILPGDTLVGTEMTLTVRTDLPTVAFSELNAGITEQKGGYATRIFQTAYLDALIKCDVRMLQNRTAESAGRFLESEQSGHIEAVFRHAGRQFWYGTKNDVKGFPGLIAQMATDADHVIDVAGTAGARSSVFFLAAGPEKVEWLFGNSRTLEFDEWKRQTTSAPVGSGEIEALISWLHFAPGARLANRNALVRIKGITAEENKTLTWDRMQDALQKCKDGLGMVPSHIFMTARSQRQLRDLSKTPENPNPPLPTSFEGIPIETTHSLSNNETI